MKCRNADLHECSKLIAKPKKIKNEEGHKREKRNKEGVR
jgi:hypothetical protein